MDWKAEDRDMQALAHIARLLVALAALAECACGRSFPVRCLILWILRPAEACARNFVGGAAPSARCAIDLRARGAVAELMRLAASFRALALALHVLARRMHRPGRRATPWCAEFRHLSQIILHVPRGPTFAALRPVDTS